MSLLPGRILAVLIALLGALLLVLPRRANRLLERLPVRLSPGSRWLREHPRTDDWLTRPLGLLVLWFSVGLSAEGALRDFMLAPFGMR